MTARSVGAGVLALLTAAGLAVDAYVHIHFGATEPPAPAGHVGEGTLFYVESAVAIVAGLLVLATRRRWAFVVGFLVGGTALAAVVVTRYYDIGAIGPIPDMYEPVWYQQKVIAAVAEAVATVAALIGIVIPRRIAPRRPAGTAPAAAGPSPAR
jgi:hypothetical protein